MASGISWAKTPSTAMITLPMVSAPLRAGRIEKMIRLADAQVVEKDLVQFVIVVLPGVHQDMLAMLDRSWPSPATGE
jgi:hypothetical protein